MRTTQISTVWLEKFIYTVLIICVTSFGALTYSDAFTPEHTHIYHLSLLTRRYIDNPLPPPAVGQIDHLAQWLARQLTPDLDLFTFKQAPSGLTYFLQSGLSHGYLLTVGRPATSQYLPPWGWVRDTLYQEDSAWLPPPDKPPII